MLRRTLRDLLLLLAYVLAVWLLFRVATRYWFPIAGLRFALLLLVPRRLFLPVAFVEMAVFRTVDAFWPGLSACGGHPDSVLVELLKYVGAASGPYLLRRHHVLRNYGLRPLFKILGAMVLSAALASLADLQFPFAKTIVGLPQAMIWLQMTLGDYIGTLVVVTLVLMLVDPTRRPAQWQRALWRFDVPIVLLPVLLVGACMLIGATGYQAYLFVSALCLIPALWMTFRTGWRGATIAIAAISLLLAVGSWYNQQVLFAMEGQLFLAITGTLTMVFGSAVDMMRLSQIELSQQARLLQQSNARLDELAGQLRETARRNLTLSEDLRRWITSELHDELGQNLSALQVRLKLAENMAAQGIHGNSPQAEAQFFEPVREIVGQMRSTLSGLLSTLRPAGLDEFGLLRALREGAIRALVETAGVAYGLRISGDAGMLARLDNDAQTALYRIVQEAATNTLRHAAASHFLVHLRLHRCGDACHVVLRCADDGTGIDPAHRGGIGLHGMEDRALSFGGQLHLRSNGRGTRLLVVMDFPLGDARPPDSGGNVGKT